MTAISYEQFLPEVLPYVRDCPEFVALNAIRNACIEFCNNSCYLKADVDPITIVIGTSSYELVAPSDMTVAKILSVSIGKQPILPKSVDELNRLFGTGWPTLEGNPLFYTQLVPTFIKLALTPSSTVTDTLNVRVALRPTRNSTTVDSLIHERWAEVIGFGARARLHDTPGQPYSDPEAARRFRAWFESGYGEATIESNKGLVRSNLRVQMPPLI